MLPNHPSLVIAEQFAMLEALHPGRVDLGIGRAPGADPMTAAALRRTVDGLGADDFPAELIDVLVLLGIPVNGHAGSLRASRLSATPAATSAPEVWLLGSSLFSAQLAGQLGLPFSYANHFNTGLTLQAADAYRSSFRPSPVLDAPHLMVSASVLVADSERGGGLPGRAEPRDGPRRCAPAARWARSSRRTTPPPPSPSSTRSRPPSSSRRSPGRRWPPPPTAPWTSWPPWWLARGADELMITGHGVRHRDPPAHDRGRRGPLAGRRPGLTRPSPGAVPRPDSAAVRTLAALVSDAT